MGMDNALLGKVSLGTSLLGFALQVGLLVLLVSSGGYGRGPSFEVPLLCGLLIAILGSVSLGSGLAARGTAAGKAGLFVSGFSLGIPGVLILWALSGYPGAWSDVRFDSNSMGVFSRVRFHILPVATLVFVVVAFRRVRDLERRPTTIADEDAEMFGPGPAARKGQATVLGVVVNLVWIVLALGLVGLFFAPLLSLALFGVSVATLILAVRMSGLLRPLEEFRPAGGHPTAKPKMGPSPEFRGGPAGGTQWPSVAIGAGCGVLLFGLLGAMSLFEDRQQSARPLIADDLMNYLLAPAVIGFLLGAPTGWAVGVTRVRQGVSLAKLIPAWALLGGWLGIFLVSLLALLTVSRGGGYRSPVGHGGPATGVAGVLVLVILFGLPFLVIGAIVGTAAAVVWSNKRKQTAGTTRLGARGLAEGDPPATGEGPI